MPSSCSMWTIRCVILVSTSHRPCNPCSKPSLNRDGGISASLVVEPMTEFVHRCAPYTFFSSTCLAMVGACTIDTKNWSTTSTCGHIPLHGPLIGSSRLGYTFSPRSPTAYTGTSSIIARGWSTSPALEKTPRSHNANDLWSIMGTFATSCWTI